MKKRGDRRMVDFGAYFGRVIAAMVTPFDENGSVNYLQAGRLARALLASGNSALVVTGTTGERPTLANNEQIGVFRAIRKAIGRAGRMIGGVTGNDPRESIEMIQKAGKWLNGILAVVPYYNRPTPEGLYQHFEAIARSTKLPCLLYNVPSRTGTNMTAETTIRLSQIPNIIGIKEASGNMEQIGTILAEAREGFLVYSGNDSDTLPILAMGGHGVVSVASHLVGVQIDEMIDSYLEGNVDEAARIHQNLSPLFRALFLVSNPSPIKYALSSLGVNVGSPRLPLVPPPEKVRKEIMDVVRQYHIDLPTENFLA